ncbi:MAG: SCO family protein [Chloroflexi bacterium]|nr:SCO family protein [Chloroflexota bacterium]
MKNEPEGGRNVSRVALLFLTALLVVAFAVACGGQDSVDPIDSNSSGSGSSAVSAATEVKDADDMAMSDDGSMDMDMDMDMSSVDDTKTATETRDPFVRRPMDRQAAGFKLTDQNGDSVSLNEFRGKWVVVDWIYTSCMTVCPALTGEMIHVRDALGDRFGKQVQFLSITFDPDRDSVEVMRKYAENVSANTNSWSWLTGSQAETDSVAQAYGVSYTPAEAMMGVAMFDHTALTILIDPGGVERYHYYGGGWSEDMIETLNNLVPEVTAGNVSLNDSDASPLAGLSVEAAALLSDATSYFWEDWELDEGITVQSVHNFAGKIPTKRYFNERMSSLEESGWTNLGKEDEGGEVYGLYYMFKTSDSDFIGVGTNENVLVEVRGENFNTTLDTLFWLGGALCCPA